ncbi:30S ribosomal protein S15 [Candidatus Babeliales bacterium]|nr:30S ribosomal protein S15 [Candidatus Babeliales bacterium]
MNVIKQFSKSDKDVGSVEVQLGLLSKRIVQVAKHLKSFPKDKHSQVGLLKMVGRKKKLAGYLLKKDKVSFDNVMQQLKSSK